MTAVIAACAALATVAVVVLVMRARSARSEQRFEAVLGQLDDHMSAISQSLQRVVERSADARAGGVDDLELTVDFDDLLRRLAAEAVTRTEAQAAAVHVVGPAGEPAAAFFGAEDGVELLEAPLGPAPRPFRAVTINWAYRPAAEHDAEAYTSALVVPIADDGTLAAYSRATGAFGAEHVRALEELAREAAPALASARRFAEAERTMTDELTGVRNRKGYEAELERAVTRARELGLPLSLLLLSVDEARSSEGPNTQVDLALKELATLLEHVTRTSDVVCRRGAYEFGVVLPETTGEAARRLYVRLREEASRAAFPPAGQTTFAAGLVEWRPNETTASFDSRASAAVGHSRVDRMELGAAREPQTGAEGLAAVSDARTTFEETLAREVATARRLTQPLTLLVMNVDAFPAEGVLGDVEVRIGTALRNGDLRWRIDESELAVVLPGSHAIDAEAVFAALQTSLEREPPQHLDRLAVSAGITELASADDPASVVSRAEHALSRARRAGSGTVVVAMANDEPRR